MHPKPPSRTTHASGTPKNLLVYDRWGSTGRPVLLLHGLLFDRTMWWPVAAELAGDCTLIAPDLPGHGDTPPRPQCFAAELAHELAALVHSLELRRAPIVVAHGTSAPLAVVFADLIATQETLTVDETRTRLPAGVDDVIAAAGAELVPDPYRQFASPRRDPAILRPYRSWFGHPLHRPVSRLRLAPAGSQPGPTADPDTSDARFPHLRDPQRFAAGLRARL